MISDFRDLDRLLDQPYLWLCVVLWLYRPVGRHGFDDWGHPVPPLRAVPPSSIGGKPGFRALGLGMANLIFWALFIWAGYFQLVGHVFEGLRITYSKSIIFWSMKSLSTLVCVSR